jgi:tRNA(Ser,Leu) C12 N-acetylase TAN1
MERHQRQARRGSHAAEGILRYSLRLCLRFTPVELVCHADLDSLKRAAARLLPPHFPGGADAAPVSFAVRAPRGRGRAGARCSG